MRVFLCTLILLQLLFVSPALFSQRDKPSVSKEPAWISKRTIDYYKTSLDKDAADGYIDISYEQQISLADQSTYFRRSRKIISQSGVQNGSGISVSFEPSYEQLTFHSIRIIRNGESLNRLQLSKIKTIHQEDELADFIYNGMLNSILILDDVRRGDVIEYSYTIKGANPIFKNKYSATYSLGYEFPVYDIYYKLIVPGGRKLNIKNLNDTLHALVSTANGGQSYEWQKNNNKPLHLQDYTPSWYDPFPQVLVSEYDSWKEVSKWAMELFPVNKPLSAAVQNKIKEIESDCKSDSAKVSAALRFVQDDIRYMGIEMGENSHKPADPSKVFAQRFGDCKEKSYLLCCMLRTMHIDAWPVLINTAVKKNLSELLPAPNVFDHVTVKVKLGEKFYWFDPTIAYQRGSINNLFYPDYQSGLLISDSSNALTPIPFRNNSNQHVQEYFTVMAMYGPGLLKVTTVYEGNAADQARSDMNNESTTELMNTYQKFYAAYYQDIKADSLTYNDNDSTGIFTTTEYYTIPDFWTVAKGKPDKFTFSSFVINSLLRRPKEKGRTMPFRLPYPAKCQEELIIDLPKDWQVTESESHLKNSCYAYNYKFYGVANHVYLETDYENYKDHATTDEAPQYFKDLDETDDIGHFELTSGRDESTTQAGKPSGINLFFALLLFVAFVGGLVWWGKRS